MNYSPIIKILTLQSSIKINEIKSFYFKHQLSKTTCLTRNTFFFGFFSVCTGHKRNTKEINENSYSLYRYQHVEVDSSLFVSERISGVRCRKLRHYSVIPFLLSLSAYSELTEITMFTGINLVQTLVQTCACVISTGSPSWFKTEIFPTSRCNQLPRPPVSKTYRTMTPLCRIEPNREFWELLHP